MVKIAVLSNEQVCINQIKEITGKTMPTIGISYVLKEYIQPQDLFDALSNDEACDIFLLDMDMPGSSCFEAARHIKMETLDSRIIYVTNQAEYAAGTYEANPYRYIPKKQLDLMLPEAYKIFCKQIEKRKKDALYYIPESSDFSGRISYGDIYYLKRERKSTLIVHKNGQFKDKKPFSEISKDCSENSCFSIIGKNYIVNILQVMSFQDRQILLRNGSILSLNEKNKEQFLKDLFKYWRQQAK